MVTASTDLSANNGSVYLYATSALSRSESDRASAKYHLVKTISPPSNDRVAVTCLSICPLQKRLVVGTMRGVVYAIQLSDYHKIGEKVEFSHDFHAGFPITCFLWDRRGARLFSACNAGLVCQTVLRAGVSAIFGSTDTELLLKEETGIVQLDLAKSERSYILMVSSQLRVLLLNLAAGDGSAVQIGTKARQGSYGACFFTSLNVEAIDPAKKARNQSVSGRPGRRIWVADPQSGTVFVDLEILAKQEPFSIPEKSRVRYGRRYVSQCLLYIIF
ncbi:Tectonin beta-propeller repeat-containing protein 2 [Phytophthora cactorum]|nr:Tectonin beta-propeller repeat-containing protein 2 [Phytophthora cactorum]